jgi:ribosomal protein S16
MRQSVRPLLFVGLLWIAAMVLGTLPAGAATPAPQWPTVEQQLQNDGVQPGSALERLIRSHQDFSILRPDEATDDRGIPPWLRVLWRQAHPEFSYRASDPSGGYPLVLKDIHEWMLDHQDLVAGSGVEEGEAIPGKTLSIGANERISGLQLSPRSESDIRIDFWSSSKVVAASNDIETGGTLAEFYSSDGGATWGQSSLPQVSGDSFQGDPAVDWTSDGTAWSTALGIISTATNVKVRAFKSTDGGATWSFDSVVSGSQMAADKEMLWSDHSATSSYKDNLYAIWTYSGTTTYINRRTASGGTWGTPQALLVSTFSAEPGADVKTNAYGDVFAFWSGTDNGASSTPNRIFVSKSTDGGVTFSSAVTVGQIYGLFQIAIPAQASRKVLIAPTTAAYRTASKDLVYAAWNDLTGATGCTSNANAPGTNTASTCKSRIWFTRSTDGGATWATPVMINNQASLNDQFFPHLSVDETTGLVSIVYYDTVNDPGRKKTDFWYQSSYDDGVTWSGTSRLTTAQTDETVTGADSGNQYGDYTGMAAYAGLFLPSWTDRRNAAKEEIWTIPVQDAAPQGPPTDKIGYVRSPANKLEFHLRLHNEVGTVPTTDSITTATGSLPLAGDWDGDGIAWIGAYDPASSTFRLHNSPSSAITPFVFGTAGAGLKPIGGDWNGDGIDTIGLYDPATGTFYLRNSNTAGSADITFTFTGASSTWLPIAGDWDGDGTTTVGLYDPATSTFYLRNSNTTGGASLTFVFGTAGAGLLPEAGDWDGDGVTTIGVYDPSTHQHQLRNTNSAGSADLTVVFGQAGVKPIAGNWTGM